MKIRRLPKSIERASRFFPLVFIVGVLALVAQCARAPSWPHALGTVAFIYLTPPLLWRLTNLVWPLREGSSWVGKGESGSPWLLTHHLQLFFVAFPAFERALILVPGLFSAWLRLWGSHIGKRVYWTPGVQIVDRTHLDIGERVFFGHRVYMSQHVVRKRGTRYSLYFKSIRIGAGTLVGFASHLSPGVEIDPGLSVAAGTTLYPNVHVSKESLVPC
jgi:hypothetical protein